MNKVRSHNRLTLPSKPESNTISMKPWLSFLPAHNQFRRFGAIVVLAVFVGSLGAANIGHVAMDVFISNVRLSEQRPTSLVVSWSTSVAATGEVEYGLTTEYSLRSNSTPLGTEHTVKLENLQSSQSMHLRVVVRDGLNNVVRSSDQVLTLPSSVDTAPPSAVTDLRVIRMGLTSVTLQWTATGDDGMLNVASEYDLRSSTMVPLWMDRFWNSNQRVDNTPVPLPSGSEQTFTVTNLQPLTTHYFAIRVKDESGNISPISNVVQARTQPQTTGDFEIRNVTVSSLFHRGAIIRWSTSMSTTTTVRLGTTTVYEMPGVFDGRGSIEHSVVLSGLMPGGVYHMSIGGDTAFLGRAHTEDFTIKTLSD